MDKLQAALAQVYGDSPDTARAQLHRYQEALSNFSVLAGHGPASVLRAPGRVNLIGEHTDYNHGYVLPIALDRDILMVARPRNDRCVNIWNMETDAFAERSFDLADQIPPYELGDWGNYVKASAQALFRLGNAGMHGMDALVAGAPPLGAPRAAGLSSSSALVVVAALAMMTHNDIRLQPVAMARLCSEAEWYVGTRGGIMDHFIAVLGERDRALLLDCRPVASDDAAQSHYHTEQIPIPPGHHLLICNSSVARQKTRSQYNVRVAECRLAVDLLSRRFPAMTHLRDVQNAATLQDLPEQLTMKDVAADPALAAVLSRLNSTLAADQAFAVRARARHVVSENERVLAGVACLRRNDAQEFGRLMNLSHRSMSVDYEASCPEVDALASIARSIEGVLGARVTGAGWGGCVVALVQDGYGDVAATIERRYRAATGLAGEVFVCRSGPGARHLGDVVI